MSSEIVSHKLYCFRCGDPLTIVNDEYYCSRGNMGLSKFLAELMVAAVSLGITGDLSEPVEKSSFRCARCRTFMKQMEPPSTGMQCPACNVQYTCEHKGKLLRQTGKTDEANRCDENARTYCKEAEEQILRRYSYNR